RSKTDRKAAAIRSASARGEAERETMGTPCRNSILGEPDSYYNLLVYAITESHSLIVPAPWIPLYEQAPNPSCPGPVPAGPTAQPGAGRLRPAGGRAPTHGRSAPRGSGRIGRRGPGLVYLAGARARDRRVRSFPGAACPGFSPGCGRAAAFVPAGLPASAHGARQDLVPGAAPGEAPDARPASPPRLHPEPALGRAGLESGRPGPVRFRAPAGRTAQSPLDAVHRRLDARAHAGQGRTAAESGGRVPPRFRGRPASARFRRAGRGAGARIT